MWCRVPGSPSNSEFRIAARPYHERLAATTRCPGQRGSARRSASGAGRGPVRGTGGWFEGDLVAEDSEPAGMVPSSASAQLLAAIAAVAPGDMAMVKDGQFMIILSGQRHTT